MSNSELYGAFLPLHPPSDTHDVKHCCQSVIRC